MEIRTATENDLGRILELGEEFGHLMLYQKDLHIMDSCVPRLLVAEEWVQLESVKSLVEKKIVGYYHYIVSGDPGFEEMLRCYRQFPDDLVLEATGITRDVFPGGICICMQGASHREVFREFIKYLQGKYPEIWCYCSIKSQRPETYKELGFLFNPDEQYTFFNCNKGDYSTYQLGRWKE